MYRAKDGMRYTRNAVKTGRVKMGKWRTCRKRLESVVKMVNQQRNNASSALRAPCAGLERGEESLHIPVALIYNDLHDA